MIYILADPVYADGIWCQKRLAELTAQLRQRRQTYRVIHELPRTWAKSSHVFLLGTSPDWVQAAITACNSQCLRPIWLCTDSNLTAQGAYSVVCTDVVRSMEKLIADLCRRGLRNIGLYGFNPDSASDIDKRNGFLAALGQQAQGRVFFNEGDLDACFRDYLARGSGVDALICCNNFAAISLVRGLKQQAPGLLRDVLILSYADTQLATLYEEHILLLGNRSQEYGRAAVTLMDMLNRMPQQTTCRLTLHWDIPDQLGKPLPSSLPREERSVDRFYQDPQVREMMQLESLLQGGEVDRCILEGLRLGKSYGTIAEENYISVNTVKYHIKQMIQTAGVSNKQGLLTLLRHLLPETTAGEKTSR